MTPSSETDPEFEALIAYIQESRDTDFRGYKRTSLRRRIMHRMTEVGIEDFDTYKAFLEAHPQEIASLLGTILINVTSFFRDAAAWDVLRDEVLPEIVGRAGLQRQIRIWSAGCASGEEPYSVAMLLAEKLGTEQFCRQVRIYATDLDEAALAAARHAVYDARAVESVPPELLERYFEHVNGHYMFQRELRKCVIFGRHNLMVDAPISRVDLLLCRNLLIYLETATQNVVLPRLHYALNQDGFLFLGKSETQLARSDQFRPVSMKHRIFRKVVEARRMPGIAAGLAAGLSNASGPQIRLAEAILDSAATAYLVVDPAGALAFSNATARSLLEVGDADLGRPFHDLSVSYRPTELRGPIEAVMKEMRPARLEHQPYHRLPGEPVRLTIDIAPLVGRDGKLIGTRLAFTDTSQVFRLKGELEALQESLEATSEELQSANEELETTNEELQSSNEELETTNEELQSTNEELETTNEELQSTNEALEQANEEQRRTVEEANRYRTFADSVLRSIDVGIIVLDREMRISSWNRWNENAWGLRSEEVAGRDFRHLDIGLPVRPLQETLERIAAGDATQEERALDALDRRGRAIRCRVRMTQLLNDARETQGAVLILENITEEQRAEDYTRHLGRVIGESLNEVYFLDPATWRFQLVNRGAEEKLGCSLPQLRQLNLADFVPTASVADLRHLAAPLIAGEQREVVFETTIRSQTGREYPAEICLQYFAREDPPILLAIVHDTSERRTLGVAAD